MIAEAFNTVARVIGYSILSMFGLAFLMILYSELKSRVTSSTETKSEYDTDTLVNDIIRERLDEPARFTEIDYRPRASCSWDWSMGRTVSREELFRIKSVLEDAGYFVHPFPRSPGGSILKDDWRWGRANMGLWTEQPTFYAKTEDGEEVNVTPDLSTWEVETRYDMSSSAEEHGYMDEWERENIHGMGASDGS